MRKSRIGLGERVIITASDLRRSDGQGVPLGQHGTVVKDSEWGFRTVKIDGCESHIDVPVFRLSRPWNGEAIW